MHESMSSINPDPEWNPDRRQSQVEDALVRLDETVAKAGEVVSNLLQRLEIVLQPEEPQVEKEGAVSPMLPTSTVVRRLDEAVWSLDSLARRMSRAMDRLDT